ncbi:immunoglobulin lambda-1 light chain-like [Myripristis murdjan]|uniref:immunoglobulin lambda-1 light chain-like n=1 Tax=Myripristis murdjan TaxID=586833 RepID=UPI001175F0D1|nr:immunoglobulin lambda-1 light chain-like [Myripristis murdjan]
MLSLPSVALCSLCLAGVAMAAQLHQDQVSLTSRTNERVYFTCTGTDLCSYNYVHWYQKKETETFKLILHIDFNDGTVHKGYNHPQKNDFSAVKDTNGCELVINKVKASHEATYYCACWKYVSHSEKCWLIFGSGTRLYVTDRLVVPPKVSIYPATRVDLKGKSSLLCLATSMFPPEVQFSWRTKDNKRTIPEREQVELREEEHAAAILRINQQALKRVQYICSVKHQGDTVEAKIPPELPAPTTSIPPVRDTAEPPAVEQSDVSFQFQCRVKLLSLVSTVMIVKSMVYCCGLSLLIIHRNKGPAD